MSTAAVIAFSAICLAPAAGVGQESISDAGRQEWASDAIERDSASDPGARALLRMPTVVLRTFDGPDAPSWETVNDNVMGGRSQGGPRFGEDGRLIFEGVTNTNGGGFSSIRTALRDGELEGTDAMLYRVRGDGRTYIAGIRTGARAGRIEVSYWARFETSEEWETVRLPYDRFVPTAHGEPVPGMVPPLRPGDARQIEFYINDGNDGPFRLETKWIGAVDTGLRKRQAGLSDDPETGREGGSPAMDGVAARWARDVLSLAIARGAPRFNDGEPGACADIYETAIGAILMRPDGLPAPVLEVLAEGIREGRGAGTARERAWAYRRAMDGAVERLGDRGLPMPEARAD